MVRFVWKLFNSLNGTHQLIYVSHFTVRMCQRSMVHTCVERRRIHLHRNMSPPFSMLLTYVWKALYFQLHRRFMARRSKSTDFRTHTGTHRLSVMSYNSAVTIMRADHPFNDTLHYIAQYSKLSFKRLWLFLFVTTSRCSSRGQI